MLEQALRVWERHYPPGTKQSYYESVTGSSQELDIELPGEALEAVRAGADNKSIWDRYREPIIALHDEDVELPESALFAYYAIYNAYRRYIGQDPVEETLLINQALSSLPQDQVEIVFLDAVQAVGQIPKPPSCSDAGSAEVRSCEVKTSATGHHLT